MTRKHLREVVELYMLKTILDEGTIAKITEPIDGDLEKIPDDSDKKVNKYIEVKCDIPQEKTELLPKNLDWKGSKASEMPNSTNEVVEDKNYYKTIATGNIIFRPGSENSALDYASQRAMRQAEKNFKAKICSNSKLSNAIYQDAYSYNPHDKLDPVTGMPINTDNKVYFLFSMEKEDVQPPDWMKQKPGRNQQDQPRDHTGTDVDILPGTGRDAADSSTEVPGNSTGQPGTNLAQSITTDETKIPVSLLDGSTLNVSIEDRDGQGGSMHGGRDIVLTTANYQWAYSLWVQNGRTEINIIKIQVNTNGTISVTAVAADERSIAYRIGGEQTRTISAVDISNMRSSLGKPVIEVDGVTFKKISGPDSSVNHV